MYFAKKEIDRRIAQNEVEETAARLIADALESDDIETAATELIDFICRELLNIETRERSGYMQEYQQIMKERWEILLDFVVDGLKGVKKIGFTNNAVDYFSRYEGFKELISTAEAQEPKSDQPRPKKQSKAAARLQSQELQEVKTKLIAAGIIVDGVWQGTPAEFGCLVAELQDERGINNHGRRAWKECAEWAGYQDDIESARSAIEKHRDTGGDVADKIRAICLANK